MKGFTLIEILISVAVIAILAAIMFSGLGSYRESSNLLRATDFSADSLNEARTKTLASKQKSVYGVHFASTTITLFQGNVYAGSNPSNEVIILPALIEISALSLSSSSPDIVFKRLTGETDNFGTITFRSIRNQDKTKVIEIYNSGLVEIK